MPVPQGAEHDFLPQVSLLAISLNPPLCLWDHPARNSKLHMSPGKGEPGVMEHPEPPGKVSTARWGQPGVMEHPISLFVCFLFPPPDVQCLPSERGIDSTSSVPDPAYSFPTVSPKPQLFRYLVFTVSLD